MQLFLGGAFDKHSISIQKLISDDGSVWAKTMQPLICHWTCVAQPKKSMFLHRWYCLSKVPSLPVIPSLQPPGESMATATRDGPRPPDAPGCPRIFSGDQRDSQVLFRHVLPVHHVQVSPCASSVRMKSENHDLRLHVTSWCHVSAHRTDSRLHRADSDRSDERTGLPVSLRKYDLHMWHTAWGILAEL